AWEMLAGGGVWWLTHYTLKDKILSPRLAKTAEICGLGIISYCVVYFTPAMQWPGYLAVVPVGAAMLVLLAQQKQSLFTSNLIARRLGASSYSIYLWHWPLVVVLNYAGEIANPQWVAVGLMLSLLLGELSLRAVENPTRKLLAKCPQKKELAWLLIALSFVGLMALVARYQNFSGRLSKNIELIINESTNKKENHANCFASSGSISNACIYGDGALSAIVIGDSHADALTTSISAAIKGGVLDLSYSSCPTIFGLTILDDNPDANCKSFNYWAKKKIERITQKVPLVIVNRTSAYLFGQHNIKGEMNRPLSFFTQENEFITDEFINEYSAGLIASACEYAINRPVFLIRPIPEMMLDVPKTMARALMFGKPDPKVSISLEEYHARHKVVWAAQDAAARQCGVKILDPLPYLCHDGRCWGSKDGRPLYYDDDHLSEFGNKLLVPMFKQAFAEQAALEHGSGRSD
ncbi:MAG: acyltransferase family protein, partial [Shewanella sp.]